MAKARDAFRTISEVSEWLDVPAHVLRFWESKFTQVKPVKRAGGRRYYRPDDMLLLGGIKALLHEQGMTIKGAQKLLREQGVKHVAGLSGPVDGDSSSADNVIEIKAVEPKVDAVAAPTPAPEPSVSPAPETPRMPPMQAMPPPTITGITAQSPTSEPSPVAPEPLQVQDPEPPVAAPAASPSDGPHILGEIYAADPDIIRANADQIAPLLARLAAVRDRMRAI